MERDLMTEEQLFSLEQVLRKGVVSILIFMVGQTSLAIWWASQISTDVRWIKEQTAIHAARLASEIDRLEKRIERLEARNVH
jgi:cell division protein FtsB